MVYIEQINLVNKTYPGTDVLKDNLKIDCSDVNILVGNQGCGKSTMLNLLKLKHSDIDVVISNETIKNGADTFYFDTEKDNPRTKDPQFYTNPNGSNKGIGFKAGLATYYKSHGEVMELFVISALLKASNSVIFLDEPESGLSITNQFKLVDAVNAAVKNNCQLFIATHSYILIKSFNVISLEHNKQLSGVDFLKLVGDK